MAIVDQRSEAGGKGWSLFKFPFHNNGEASNSHPIPPSVSSVARSLLPTRRRLRLDPSNKLYFPCKLSLLRLTL